MDSHQLYLDLKSQFPDIEIFENHPLAPYTTLNIGGPADILIQIKSSEQLLSIINFIYRTERFETVPYTILGHGSNVLISDRGIRGIVIINSFVYQGLEPFPSGALLQPLILYILDQNLLGLEEFAYIPATLGGAISSNIHGVDKNNFNKFLQDIQVFDFQTGQTSTLQAVNLPWDYDTSYFQAHPKLIILSANLRLASGPATAAKEKYAQIIQAKTQTQPMNSAGCVFKNPPNDSAGRIIDRELNLKGTAIGGAQISPLHANFIVNTGSATAADYLALVRLVQSEAKKKLNLNLELEIKLLGEF